MQGKKLKIGIVGLNFGRWIIGELQKEEGGKYFQVAGVCDIDAAKTDQAAKDFGVKAYYSLGRLLKESDIPVVGLFTGPSGRAGLIQQIIRAGKDVITTKPLELNPGKALDVLREAKRMGRVVHLNSPSPLLPPDLCQIEEWRRKYSLGRPVACRRDTWVSYREKLDGSWYDDPEKCPVPPVFRLGIYLINDLVRIFGEAEKVQVMQSRLFTGRPTSDNAQLSVLFKNGGLASIFASFCVNDGQSYENSMVLNYENGTIYRNAGPSGRGKSGAKSRMCVVVPDGSGGLTVERAELKGHSGEYQWEAFYHSVKGEKIEDEVTPEEVVAGLRIINAMARAAKTGCAEIV